jgi:hypothetical protein
MLKTGKRTKERQQQAALSLCTGRSSARSVQEIAQALAAPFPPEEIRFKPAVVSGQRALALAYVDARAIQDRLDEVLGVLGWQDSYQVLPDGSVVCRLRLRLGDEWITKMDVGSPSEQPDGGDRLKAAFSDALKRAAVKFGIGRYLYRLPPQWVAYDPQRKQFVQPPRLLLPGGASTSAANPAAEAEAVPAASAAVEIAAGTGAVGEDQERTAPLPPGSPTGPTGKAPAQQPATGAELEERLRHYEQELVAQGRCPAGALLEQVRAYGQRAGYGADLKSWPTSAIPEARQVVRTFLRQLATKEPVRKQAG